jgi:hypothetical protein
MKKEGATLHKKECRKERKKHLEKKPRCLEPDDTMVKGGAGSDRTNDVW